MACGCQKNKKKMSRRSKLKKGLKSIVKKGYKFLKKHAGPEIENYAKGKVKHYTRQKLHQTFGAPKSNMMSTKKTAKKNKQVGNLPTKQKNLNRLTCPIHNPMKSYSKSNPNSNRSFIATNRFKNVMPPPKPNFDK